MKPYKYLFFDLDHTLWDYDHNASETLLELYDLFDLGKYGIVDADYFKEVFFYENEKLWEDLNAGLIDKFYLRSHRFRLVMEAAQANMKSVTQDLIEEINTAFLSACSRKKQVIEGAFEVLDHCHGKYDLHIITNGFEEVQAIKMKYSGLDKYFDKIITSEKAGHKKPNAGIYTYALKHTGAEVNQSLMIGDNLHTDIKGARAFGMDQVYFNPEKKAHNTPVTAEIDRLIQLLDILEGSR